MAPRERRNDERDRLRQAVADELRELKEADPDEISEVAEDVVRAMRASRPDSTPATAKGIVAVLNTLPPWARLPALLAVIAAAAYGGGHQLGWW